MKKLIIGITILSSITTYAKDCSIFINDIDVYPSDSIVDMSIVREELNNRRNDYTVVNSKSEARYTLDLSTSCSQYQGRDDGGCYADASIRDNRDGVYGSAQSSKNIVDNGSYDKEKFDSIQVEVVRRAIRGLVNCRRVDRKIRTSNRPSITGENLLDVMWN